MRNKRSMGIALGALAAPAAFIAAATAAPLQPLSAAAGPLAASKSRATLVSSGPLSQGRYRVGLDVALAPGVLTYWTFPGDAGVPPVFSFAGSKNVEKARAGFPAPARIDDDGVTTFGYRTEVLFPITVTPEDPTRPAQLDVTLHYATCDTICVPAETHQSLTLSPDAPADPDAARIAAWAARVPSPLPPALSPQVQRLAAGAKAKWRVVFPHSAAKTDLFVVAAEGWYFDSRPLAAGTFQVSLAQTPIGAAAGIVPVTLTYVDGDRAYQAEVNLDARGG